jgi:glycosyltransferase involved in cell wall biosynthesis
MKLSIVIRCRNEAGILRLALEALQRQQCSFEWEIIVVDNESLDDSRQVAETFGARIVSISAAEFTYGRALNLGFSKAQGELVMSLSAHSILIGTSALENAVAPFEDGQVAAARCLSTQAPSSIKQWFHPVDLQKRRFHHNAGSTPGVVKTNVPVCDPDEWHGKRHPNNACSVIRKSVWQQFPFHETLETAEDKHWAQQVLEAGYKIRHCAECVFFYCREHPPEVQLLRRQRELLAHYRFGSQPALKFDGLIHRIGKAHSTAIRLGIAQAHAFLKHEVAIAFFLYKLPRIARKKHIGSKGEFVPAPISPTKVGDEITDKNQST